MGPGHAGRLHPQEECNGQAGVDGPVRCFSLTLECEEHVTSLEFRQRGDETRRASDVPKYSHFILHVKNNTRGQYETHADICKAASVRNTSMRKITKNWQLLRNFTLL